MSEAGYTLAETLAALVMIGLAVGGLAEGAQVLGRLQAASAKASRSNGEVRRIGQAMDSVLKATGPFASDAGDFEGKADRFSFDCGRARCGAVISTTAGVSRIAFNAPGGAAGTIDLGKSGGWRFAYADRQGVGETWPPSGYGRRALKSVLLLQATAGGERAVSASRLWREQPAACSFDDIVGDCRKETP